MPHRSEHNRRIVKVVSRADNPEELSKLFPVPHWIDLYTPVTPKQQSKKPPMSVRPKSLSQTSPRNRDQMIFFLDLT